MTRRMMVFACLLACGCHQKVVNAIVSDDTEPDNGADEESNSGPGASTDTEVLEPVDDDDFSDYSTDVHNTQNAQPQFELGTCFGDNIDCTAQGREFILEHAPDTTCSLDDKGVAHVEWIDDLSSLGCDQTPCNFEFTPVEVSSQGHITGLGRTFQPAAESAGLSPHHWLARFDSSGQQIYNSSLDSDGLLMWQGLALDSLGQTFLLGFLSQTTSELSIGVAITQYASDGSFLSRAIEMYSKNVIQGAMAIGPQNELLLSFGYVSNMSNIEYDLAKFDNDGNLIWNHAQVSKNPVIVALGLDVDDLGNTWLLLNEYVSEYENGPKKTVVRIDSDGNEVWRGNLPKSWESYGMSIYHIAAVREGGFFLYRDKFYMDETGEPGSSDKWVEKFDEDGTPIWSWQIPITSPTILEADFISDNNGDVFITLVEGSPGDNAVNPKTMFYRISSNGTTCAVSELPFTWCLSDGSCGIEVRSDENGKYYYNGVHGLAHFSID